MELFSKTEIIVMASILAFILFIIIVLTVLDFLDERKSRKNNDASVVFAGFYTRRICVDPTGSSGGYEVLSAA